MDLTENVPFENILFENVLNFVIKNGMFYC